MSNQPLTKVARQLEPKPPTFLQSARESAMQANSRLAVILADLEGFFGRAYPDQAFESKNGQDAESNTGVRGVEQELRQIFRNIEAIEERVAALRDIA